MTKLKFSTLSIFIGIFVLCISAAAFGADQNSALGGVDTKQITMSAGALKLLKSTLPSASAVIITFFVFQSFLLTYLSDQQFHRWAVRVAIGIIIGSALLGGSVSQALGIKTTRTKGSLQGITSSTNPGENGQATTAPGGTLMTFEIYAKAFDNDDDTLAVGIGDNMAGVPVNMSQETTYFVKSENLPANLKKVIDDLNADEDESAVLSSVTVLLNNSVTAPATTVLSMYDNAIIVQAAKDTPQEIDTSASASSEIENLFAAADAGSTDSNTIIAAIPSTYFGDPVDVGRFMIDRAYNPEIAVAARMSPTEELVSANEKGSGTPNITSPTSNTFTNTAKEAGFDSAKEGVYAQYFPRTHYAEFKAECQNNLGGVRGDSVNSSNMPTNPCSIAASDPIATRLFGSATSGLDSLQTYATQITEIAQLSFSLLNSFSGNGTGQGNTSVAALSSSAMSALTQAKTLASGDFSSFSTACDMSQIHSFEDARKTYDTLLTKQEELGNSYNKSCLEIGRAISVTSEAMYKTQLANDEIVDKYLTNSSPRALENSSVYAHMMYTDTSRTDGAPENLASIQDVVREITGLVSSISGAAVGAVKSAKIPNVVQPTVSEVNKSKILEASGLKAKSTKDPSVGNESLPNSAWKDSSGNTYTPFTDSNGVRAWKKSDPSGKDITLTTFGEGYQDATVQQNYRNALKAEREAKAAKEKGEDPPGFLDKLAEGIGKIIVNVAMFFLRIIAIVLLGIPVMALLAQYAIVEWTARIAYACGMALLPIWALFSLGKNFVGQSAGDDSVSGFAFFPIVTIIISQAALGAELNIAALCKGEVMFFLHNSLANMANFAFAMMSSMLDMTFANSSSNPFNFMLEAMKPFGVIAGAAIGPAMLAKVLTPGVISTGAVGSAASQLAGTGTSAAAKSMDKTAEILAKAIGAGGGGGGGGSSDLSGGGGGGGGGGGQGGGGGKGGQGGGGNA